MIVSRQLLPTFSAVAALVTGAVSQTWTACDPTKTTCAPNAALGMSINVDFTKGSVNSFLPSGGNPTYGSDGVTFPVSRGGDAPQLGSVFYIMFGHVEVNLKCAPGAGIVSSLVLQSDDLDEIDFEWLGADNAQVQTNYFGKGKTDGFNRGQFHANANNQGQFITYAIDWTPDRIIWSIGGVEIRTLKFDDARGQYPQTPMQIKFGAWSGGDPANPPGTIDWAKGPTDYSKGPFSMAVKSAKVTDYSTGKQYKWGDMSGTWQSIIAVDGKVNGNAGSKGNTPTLTATAAVQPSTTSGALVPVGGIGRGSSTTTVTPLGSLPSGWVMTSSGKMMPSGSSTSVRPSRFFLIAGSIVAITLSGWLRR